MTRSTTVLILSSFIFFACGQNKIPKQAVINSIIQRDVYEDMYESFSYQITTQWKNYEALRREFSEKELIELCGHKNPIVRSYAFKALTEKGSSKVYNTLLQHLSDTASFVRHYGCFIEEDRVTDNFLYEVGYGINSSSKFKLTEQQYEYIDSILLFREEITQKTWNGSMKYNSRSYMLERLKPLPKFYKRLKEIVNDSVYKALSLLAQYKEPSDTLIFKKLLSDDEFSNRGRLLKHYVRNSIKYFAHPCFYSILKEQLLSEVGTNAISDDFESFPLYIALVQYPTDETKKLFEKVLQESGDEYEKRLSFISKAVQQYPSRVFDDFIGELSKKRSSSYSKTPQIIIVTEP